MSDLVPQLTALLKAHFGSAFCDDMLQVALIAAWRASASHDPARSALVTYARKSILGAATNWLRSERRHVHERLDERMPEQTHVEELIYQKQLIERLDSAEQQAYVSMLQGETQREAAQHTGFSKTAVQRMRAKLKRPFASSSAQSRHGQAAHACTGT